MSWLSTLTSRRASRRACASASATQFDGREQFDIAIPWYYPVFATMPLVPELYLRFRKNVGVRRFDDRRRKFVYAGGFQVASVPSKTYCIGHEDIANALAGYAEIARRMLGLPEAELWVEGNRRNLIELWTMADWYAPMVRSPHDALRVFVMVHRNDKARNRRAGRYPVIYGVAIFDGEKGGGGNPIVISHPLTQPTIGNDRTRGNIVGKQLVGLLTEECADPGPRVRRTGQIGERGCQFLSPSGRPRGSSDTQTSGGKLSTDEDWSQSSNPAAALATAKLATRWANAMMPLDRDFRLAKMGETLTVLANRQLMKEGRLARTLTVEVTSPRSRSLAHKWGAAPHARPDDEDLSGA